MHNPTNVREIYDEFSKAIKDKSHYANWTKSMEKASGEAIQGPKNQKDFKEERSCVMPFKEVW